MTHRPNALNLADALDQQYLHACKPAAAELRRLHAEVMNLRRQRAAWVAGDGNDGWIDQCRNPSYE